MWNNILIAVVATVLFFSISTEEELPVKEILEQEVQQQVVIVNDTPKKEIECLAKNIYFEARGEPIEGQVAVAAVTINRVNADKFPKSICKVVHQPYQFSWVQQLKSHTPKSKAEYELAVKIATGYIEGKFKDPTYGSTYYHADYVNPRWNKFVNKKVKIGSHIFYSQ